MLQYGPLSVSINAGPLNGYPGGVINCTGEGIDHAVTLVGFGIDDDGKKYWKVKNRCLRRVQESSLACKIGRQGGGVCHGRFYMIPEHRGRK